MGLITTAVGAQYREDDNHPWTLIRYYNRAPEYFLPTAIAVSDSGRMAFVDELSDPKYAKYSGAFYRLDDALTILHILRAMGLRDPLPVCRYDYRHSRPSSPTLTSVMRG
jgi:hypothetical protein